MGKGLEEREINLWDMFWAVCLKWRSILVCAVIFAILAGGFSYVRSASEADEATAIQSLDNIASLFEEGEQEEVNDYLRYIEICEQQQSYNQESPIMTLNADGYYIGQLNYYIDNFYENIYPTISVKDNVSAFVDAYVAAIRTDEVNSEVKRVLELDEDNLYAYEVISAGSSYEDEITQGLLKIVVQTNEKATCEEMLNVIKQRLTETVPGVKKQLGNHDLIEIQSTINYTTNPEVLDYQRQNLEKVDDFKDQIIDLSENFTDNQALYVEVYQEQMSESAEEADVQIITNNPTVSLKLIVIGFIGGAFLAFVLYALGYIFDGKIRREDDFEAVFGGKMIGVVSKEKTPKRKLFGFIDKLFEKMRHYNQRYFEREEALEIIASNIRIAMTNASPKKVAITGAICSEDEGAIVAELSEKLKKDNIELVFERSILYNAEALENVVDAGCVVLMEKDGKTYCHEIKKEMDICTCQNIKLIGCVVVY